MHCLVQLYVQVATTHRQSVKNTKSTSQPWKKRQDKVDHHQSLPRPPRPPRPEATSSTKKQPRKRLKSADSARSKKKNGSKLSQPSGVAPSPGVGVDTESSGSKEESGNADKNVSDHKTDEQASHVGVQGVSSELENPSLTRSKSKSGATRQSSRGHTPLPNQQTQSSTADSMKRKSAAGSDGTGSVAPPISRPSTPPVFTILTRSQKRQSIQFTENSLKVSFKRRQSLSPSAPTPSPSPGPTPAPAPFILGTNLDMSPSTFMTTIPSNTKSTVKRSSSKKASTAVTCTSTCTSRSTTVTVTESDMPSSQQLAEFFSSMTPLSAPVSPKSKPARRSGSLSIGTNSQEVHCHVVSRSSSIPASSPLSPRSNVNVSAPVCSTTTTPPVSRPSANNYNVVPSIPHSVAPSSTTNSVYGTPFPSRSKTNTNTNANANTSNMIRSVSRSTTITTSSTNYSSNAPLHIPPHLSAPKCTVGTPSSTNTSPLISNFGASSRPTSVPALPYSSAPVTISSTPNSVNSMSLISILGTGSKSTSTATNLHVQQSRPHSSIATNVPNSINSPPSGSNFGFGSSFNAATVPQAFHSSITANSISTPLISSLGIAMPNSINTPPSSNFRVPLNVATTPQASHSSATATHISTPTSIPNSTSTSFVSNRGTSLSATAKGQIIPHSLSATAPCETNTPLISSTGTPNSTNVPSVSNCGASLSATAMPQVSRSTATAIACSTPNSTSNPKLGASTPNSTTMPLNSSNLGTCSKSSVSPIPSLSTSPSLSSPTAHYSITTQARLPSEPSTSMSLPVAQSETSKQSSQQTAKDKTKPPKPTFSSIYQQLVADKKIKPSKSGAGKKPPRKKKAAPSSLPPSSSTVAGLGGAGTTSKGSASEKGAKKSTKQGLSSKLSSPLCTTFPTFVIPHMPMSGGGGGDPNLLVSPVWLGPGSFSGLMSTVPYPQAPPPATTPTAPPTSSTEGSSMDNPWSQGLPSSTQATTSNAPHNLNNFSMPSVASQAASNQQSPALFGFGSTQQFGSFHSPVRPAFPVDLQLNPLANNSGSGTSSSGSSTKTPPSSSVASDTTADSKNTSGEEHNTTARSGRKRPSKLISSMSITAMKGSTPTSQSTASGIPTVSSSQEQPRIDMYPDSPPSANRQMGKTLQYHSLNDSRASHSSTVKSPNTPRSFPIPTQTRSLSTSSSTPMSPPTHMPTTNKPGRFHFPSISSPLALTSSLPSTTFSSLTTMLKSPTSSTGAASSSLCPFVTTSTSARALSSPTSQTAQDLITVSSSGSTSTAVSSSGDHKTQDVNSLEYRKLILRKVQQWNEQKQKMMQGRTERLILKSPPMFADGSLLSPTGSDMPLNLCSTLRSPLLSSPTDAPGSTGYFKVAVSLPNASRENSPASVILGLGSPKLLTVGPPVTFTDTLPPRSSPNSNPPSSLELASSSTTSASGSVTPSSPALLKSPSVTTSVVTSPTVVPSVVSNAVRMDDITMASYSSSMVAPSVVFNSSFMGDISAMSRWELEQLYKHNMEKLEQQKKFISILEAQLKHVREQHDSFSIQKPSESELYKRFLSFVVEPELIPDVSSICSNKFGYGHLSKQSNGAKTIKPTLDFNEIIKGGTFDRPVLNEKYDFYANFGHS